MVPLLVGTGELPRLAPSAGSEGGDSPGEGAAGSSRRAASPNEGGKTRGGDESREGECNNGDVP